MSSIKRELIERYGKIYTTDQMLDLFDVGSFCAPYVMVPRKKDGAMGTIRFSHSPRYYFDFKES